MTESEREEALRRVLRKLSDLNLHYGEQEEAFILIRDALARQSAPQGEPVAWLHEVVQSDGEPDQALSFSPDNFPLEGVLGFKSIKHIPLYASPLAQPDADVVRDALCQNNLGPIAEKGASSIEGTTGNPSLSPESSDLFNKLGETAVAFINSFQDHLGRCRACDIAWQNLRIAIDAAMQSAPKPEDPLTGKLGCWPIERLK